MKPVRGGRAFAVALAALGLGAGIGSTAPAGTLSVEAPGGTLFAEPVPEGAGWCLSWNHSVTGGPVADCFVNNGGQMVLDRSFLHDFAAGLGEVPGRGRLVSAKGGGYWIEAIGEPVKGNALPLRVGRAAVDHRLHVGGTEHRLSAAAAGQRVTLRLAP